MPMDLSQLQKKFPDLHEPQLLEEMLEEGHFMEVEQGDIIVDYGSYIRIIPLIIDGVVRVVRPDQNGKELLLYYLQAGDTCAISLNGCTIGSKSTIVADAMQNSTIMGIPIKTHEKWLAKFNSWRTFVFSSYGSRFNDLLYALDEVAFSKLDDRLIHYLEAKQKFTGNNTIEVSHSQIAQELHSSREVISRLLKKLENNGAIKMGRNQITLVDL